MAGTSVGGSHRCGGEHFLADGGRCNLVELGPQLLTLFIYPSAGSNAPYSWIVNYRRTSRASTSLRKLTGSAGDSDFNGRRDRDRGLNTSWSAGIPRRGKTYFAIYCTSTSRLDAGRMSNRVRTTTPSGFLSLFGSFGKPSLSLRSPP